ncbi:glycosyltransferase family 2 protein [Trueperella pecoris]|uniref:Glycosyltransferase family 2 protein n=1 Tax=Trueperella pecoris TaxID=2733571 RepID=A0A7M1R1U6_9ACTO|nr:glycosyltransferase family 2 protein [Trueperella pecoris]QOR48302.1 glycosyltransferase family 2 protein [Trueperella pecoris]
MKIDIMVPYWGSVAWLRELIDSVLTQDDEQWRLVIVDDCNPGEEARKLVEGIEDPRVEYVRNEENLGLNANFRRCLDLSTAEYLVIPGSDDRFLPNYVSSMRAAVDEFHPDVVQPGVRVIDESGKVVCGLPERIKAVIRSRQAEAPQPRSGEGVAKSLMHGNWMYWPSLLLRREAVATHGFRDFSIMLDLGLVVDVLLADGNLLVLDDVSFEYRRSTESVSGKTALDGKRFVDEADYFRLASRLFYAHGWPRAARAARLHLTSRLHALILIPQALRSKEPAVVPRLLKHALR